MIDIHKMIIDGERLVYAVPGNNHEVFVYIPDCQKEEIFKKYSPFDKGDLDQKLYDLHCGKCCYYRECKIVYDLSEKLTYIVSPFYPEGGTILDLFQVTEDYNPNIDPEDQPEKIMGQE